MVTERRTVVTKDLWGVGSGQGKQGCGRKGEKLIRGRKVSDKMNSGHIIHGKYAN